MADKHERQRRAFDFLTAQGIGSIFELDALDEAAGWSPGTAYTYSNKYYEDFMLRDGNRASLKRKFRTVTFDDFLDYSTQVKTPRTRYVRRTYPEIVDYEFLLPLRHETELRQTLDSLFFEDTLVDQIRILGLDHLRETIAQNVGETDADYTSRMVGLVGSLFSGYSISHVDGRYRAGSLTSREQAVGQNYLIDETTAVVRFIVPIMESIPLPIVRSLFFDFFVVPVIETARGEDEVWLIEESPDGHVLHVWEKTKKRRQ